MKRFFAFFLSLALLLGCCPMLPQQAAAAEEIVAQDSDMTVESTNSFGHLLAQDLEQEEAEEAEKATVGYNVIGLTIEDGVATVEYDTRETANLVVALYTEDGMQQLLSAHATVEPEETVAQLTFADDLPDYFLASAYLLDSYDYSPLCTAYETPMYTREMQELLASTTDDYDADRVLNLDEDETTNFAVFAENTLVLAPTEGVNTVTSVDDKTATYVIENADEKITSLKSGDIFAYPYSENEILIVKVDTIIVDGTTATITGAELKMEEAFSHVKIENVGKTEDALVDDSTGDEGISYTGLVTYEDESVPTRGGKTEVEYKNFLGFDVDKKWGSVTFKGSLGWDIDVRFSYYVTVKEQFIEFKVDQNLKFKMNISAKKVVAPLDLPSVGFFVVPGVYIGFEPRMEFNISAKLDFSFGAEQTIGFSYTSGKPFKNLSTDPRITADADVQGTVTAGLDLNPSIKILDGWIAECSLTAFIGVELKGTIENHTTLTDETALSVHECNSCLSIEVKPSIKLQPKLEFLRSKALTITCNIFEISFNPSLLYHSYTYSELGLGSCPHKTYRVTVCVQNINGEAVPGTEVFVRNDTDYNRVSIGTTNDDGVVVTYQPKGTYTYDFTSSDVCFDKQVTVKEACRVVLWPGMDDNNSLFIDPDAAQEKNVVSSGTCGAEGDNVRWTLYSNGLLDITGVGAIADVGFYDDSSLRDAVRRSNVQHVNIHRGITRIGESAFSSSQIDEITIPSSVTSIGRGAFFECDELKKVHITDIGAWLEINFEDRSANPLVNNGPPYENYLAELYLNGDIVRDLVIPNGVVSISNYAFYSCETLRSVVIPTSVTTIGNSAFEYCPSLTSVTIPDSVTAIGESAFKGCSSLTSVTIPDSVTSISDTTFFMCSSLTSITIPDSVTTIGRSAFCECTNLTSLTIGNNVTTIGAFAFSSCYSLTSVTIPDSVNSLDATSFICCTNLSGIWVSKYNPSFSSNDQGVLFNKDKTLLIKAPNPLSGSYTIPENVITIGGYAFYDCSNLTSVTIPNSVITISERAFDQCESLFSVTIPDSVTSIGDQAFCYNDNLTHVYYTGSEAQWEEITIGKSNVSLLDAVIHYATDAPDDAPVEADPECLKYSIADGMVTITDCDTSANGTLTIPTEIEGYPVTNIGDYAFDSCELLNLVTIPDSVTTIGNYAFNCCKRLSSITIPGRVTSIGRFAFYNCKSLTTVTIGGSVAYIGRFAFNECTGLIFNTYDSAKYLGNSDNPYFALIEATDDDIATCTIHEETRIIASDAFNYCPSLTTVTIPDSVTAIGDYAFAYCESFYSVIFGEGVTNIGKSVFYETGLLRVVFRGDAPKISEDAFSGVYSLITVYYPSGNPTWTWDVVGEDYGASYCSWEKYTPGTKGRSLLDRITSANSTTQKVEADIFEETASKENVQLDSVYNGEFQIDEYKKTVTFRDLVPGQEYVLLVVRDLEANDFLGSSNLRYIRQGVSGEDGTLTFTYTVYSSKACFAIACGASNQNLRDAQISIPATLSSEEVRYIQPVVTYNGQVLAEGVDYTVSGAVAYSAAGTYTCYIRGIRQYTGTVECTYTVVDCIPGDLDGNETVNEDDAIYLLQYVLMPDLFPVEQPVDYDQNGEVNEDDAIYLLQYVLMPDLFPLM